MPKVPRFVRCFWRDSFIKLKALAAEPRFLKYNIFCEKNQEEFLNIANI